MAVTSEIARREMLAKELERRRINATLENDSYNKTNEVHMPIEVPGNTVPSAARPPYNSESERLIQDSNDRLSNLQQQRELALAERDYWSMRLDDVNASISAMENALGVFGPRPATDTTGYKGTAGSMRIS